MDTTLLESTLTAKGQTTVPQQVRQALGGHAGTKLTWAVQAGGAVLMRAKNKSILDLAGMLKAPVHQPISALNGWQA